MERFLVIILVVALFFGGYYIMRKIDKFMDDFR